MRLASAAGILAGSGRKVGGVRADGGRWARRARETGRGGMQAESKRERRLWQASGGCRTRGYEDALPAPNPMNAERARQSALGHARDSGGRAAGSGAQRSARGRPRLVSSSSARRPPPSSPSLSSSSNPSPASPHSRTPHPAPAARPRPRPPWRTACPPSSSAPTTRCLMSSARARMASSGQSSPALPSAQPPDAPFRSPLQLRHARSLPAQGRHQAHHPLRPFHVLSPHPPRNQAPPPLSSREHHLNTRHPPPSLSRRLQRGLSRPGAHGDRSASRHSYPTAQ